MAPSGALALQAFAYFVIFTSITHYNAVSVPVWDTGRHRKILSGPMASHSQKHSVGRLRVNGTSDCVKQIIADLPRNALQNLEAD